MRILSSIRTHPTDSLVLKWHSASLSRRTIQFFRLACLVFSAVSFWGFFAIRHNYADDCGGSGGEWVGLGLGLIFGLAGVFLLIETITTIDLSQRKVWREPVFLGWFVLFPRSFEFSDFTAAIVRCDVDSEGAWDTFFLGLKRANGRRLWIQYWNVSHKSPCEQAREFADKIAHALGIPIEK